jgi:hypothetical protein
MLRGITVIIIIIIIISLFCDKVLGPASVCI